jgi:hypothetical protein
MNKEKIKEILLHLDSYFEQAMGTEVTREDCVNLRKELSDLISTLIQAERKDAVEGFADWLDNVLMTQMRKPYIYGEQLKSAVETYLESEGK